MSDDCQLPQSPHCWIQDNLMPIDSCPVPPSIVTEAFGNFLHEEEFIYLFPLPHVFLHSASILNACLVLALWQPTNITVQLFVWTTPTR